MQPGEQVIFEIKRHPIGMLFNYCIVGSMIIATAAMAFVVAPSAAPNNREAVTAIATVVFFIVTTLAMVFIYISNKVYWGNSWVLTTDSLTQVTQTSLFNRQSSQLSLENLEDVTALQNGILPHVFGYGVLKAETAGEHSKFIFHYCANPNYYAQKILDAREKFAQQGGHEGIHQANQQ